MRLLRELEEEVEAEQSASAAYQPPMAHAAQAQSAELLGQAAPAPMNAAQAQAAEMAALQQDPQVTPAAAAQGPAPGELELPPQVIELLLAPEAEEVLGPLTPALAPPTAAAVERVRRLIDEPMPDEVQAERTPYTPGLPTIHEVPEVERDPTVATEANHPVTRTPAHQPTLPRINEVPEVERDPTVATEANHPVTRAPAHKPTLPRINEVPEVERDPTVATEAHQPVVRPPAHQPSLPTIHEHQRPEKATPRRAKVAQEIDGVIGPGVASSAQGPGDAVAHVLGMKHVDGSGDPQFGQNAAAFGTGMGLTGGAASVVGSAARVYNAQRALREGRDKAKNAVDDSERRTAAAQVRGAVVDLAGGTNATASSGMGVGATVAELAGAAVPAAVGLTGGVLGAVGGSAAMVRHGRKGNRALRRYRALQRLKESITDPELQTVRAYAVKKNRRAAVIQGVQSTGGALGTGAGVAAGVALAASAATPVGWGLAAAAAGVGLGAAGYMSARKVYKERVVKPRRAAAGLDPDKRRAMATKLQEKLGDRDEAVRAEARSMVEALGLTEEQALGADGIELLKKKMRTT